MKLVPVKDYNYVLNKQQFWDDLRSRYNWQKQPPGGVLRTFPKNKQNECPENKQQIYRRTPMSKCDFNKVV